MRNFRKLEVWQESIKLCKAIYTLTETFPQDEKFGLTNQMRRSAVSIASNLAEGSSRKSSKEFSKYIDYSLGSSFELETQLIISIEVGLVKNNIAHKIIDNLTTLQRRLNALRKSVLTYSEPKTKNQRLKTYDSNNRAPQIHHRRKRG